MNWMDIDKNLRNLWVAAKGNGPKFLELVISKYGWSERQAIQNTGLIYSENNQCPPTQKEIAIKRK